VPDKPQNIYDDPGFFAGYSTLERFGAGWTRAVEHDDLVALLPDAAGLRVLDLGCGAGQLARFLAAAGAAEVVGVDISERMLALARAQWSHPRVTYHRLAIEELAFPPARFDLVVSSLALHYVDDYPGLMRSIADWLAPGGHLVFSTEHPIYTACPTNAGWALNDAGQRIHWAVDRYADEGPRESTWFVPGVRRMHRMLETLINGVLDAGLVLERVIEPAPSGRWLREHPDAADERRRPMFVLLRARKPA
jgi:2-polyprenyl-3-methyl-5-hydroxy-6-metoxy-1,4-benzoquinol methylase